MAEVAYNPYVEKIEILIREVSWVIKKMGRKILNDFDITPPQFSALLYLMDEPDGYLTIGDLCKKMALAYSTVTDLVDRMEKGGLVERERDLQDRRVVRVKMKERGQEVINQVIESRRRFLAGILEHVTDEEKEALVQSLTKLHNLMGEEISE